MSDKEPKGWGRQIKDTVLSILKVVKENPVQCAVGAAILLIILVAVC